MDAKPYNPLDKINLGKSVADALLERPALPLGDLEPFRGAGVYALYYTGDLEIYSPLAEKNREGKFSRPIYVGKAASPGARKGNVLDAEPGQALYKRLRDHADSLSAAENLLVEDFYCRFLVVDDIWIPLGESLLIAKFSPIWNKIIDGFGNHDPGSGRHGGMKPRWDALHPGRVWADRCSPRTESQEQIRKEIESYFANRF